MLGGRVGYRLPCRAINTASLVGVTDNTPQEDSPLTRRQHTTCAVVRGREPGYPGPPAQIRTSPIKASGSYQEYLAASSVSLRLVARDPAPVTRLPGSVPGTCFAGSRSSQSPPFAPPAPSPVARFCSLASLLLWRSQTSRVRASSASTHRLPNADQRYSSLVKPEISRFPHKERPHVPGSPTTPGWASARDDAPVHVAFRDSDHVGTRDYLAFAAPWLARALPCRRFADTLADANARLGADADRYAFIVRDFHLLLFAGFDRRTRIQIFRQ